MWGKGRGKALRRGSPPYPSDLFKNVTPTVQMRWVGDANATPRNPLTSGLCGHRPLPLVGPRVIGDSQIGDKGDATN